MNKLLKLLNYIENNEEIEPIRYLSSIDNQDIKDIVITIQYLAAMYLLKSNSLPNRDNIKRLEQNGFKVTPGDTDLDKWLSACIKTSKGVIVFNRRNSSYVQEGF